jgi:hypothetical protein
VIDRRVWRVLATLVLGGAVIAAPLAAPERVAAAPSDILVSTDGTTFTEANLVDPLAGIGLLVPGDSVQRSMWVRNSTARDAYFRLTVSDLVMPLSAYPDAITVTTTNGTSSRFDRLSDLTVCSALVRSASIQAGAVARVDFTIAMDSSVPGLVAQDETAQFGVRVAMRDVVGGPYPNVDGCVSDNGGAGGSGGASANGPRLPFTGTDAIPLIILAVTSLTGGILAIIIARRRRRRDETETP